VVPGPTAWCQITHSGGEWLIGPRQRGVAAFRPDEDDLAFAATASIIHSTYCSGLEDVLPELARWAAARRDVGDRRRACQIYRIDRRNLNGQAVDATNGDQITLKYVDDAIGAHAKTVILAGVEAVSGKRIFGKRGDSCADSTHAILVSHESAR
jgi:hypothetical protein